MSAGITVHTDIGGMMQSIAKLKRIPLNTVIFNATKDFVKAARYATPTARLTKSPYYIMFGTDGKPKLKNGKPIYVHENQIFRARKYKSSRKYWNAMLRPKKGNPRLLRRVRIRAGWSRYSWRGAYIALGMGWGNVSKRGKHAVDLSSVQRDYDSQYRAQYSIVDFIRFNRFDTGGSDYASPQIFKAGFAAAALNIIKTARRLIQSAWNREAK